jgi:hypothetical protein
MSIPDSEAPEQSLGDCAICMDAILVDPSMRRPHDKEHDTWGTDDTGANRLSMGSAGGLLNAMQKGMEGTKKNYSLAPCHHLFVSANLESGVVFTDECLSSAY